ncbi:WD40 repeat domain-containing protein [Candidatus Albibeggiatoa sp. nov. NOAA]|uniref:WD40 repeat domain-containing protein n=1 Tax=Candidatus Albibeggiatoa sp. nov. NOAA TaxID=3162724 RepID=UPI00330088E3|nr:WD40 repeat domain-containing protein [Thiotrichaceae bacterium]
MYNSLNVKQRFQELQQWYAERRQRHIHYLQTIERGRVEWSISQLLQQKPKAVEVYAQIKTKKLRKLSKALLKKHRLSFPIYKKYRRIIITLIISFLLVLLAFTVVAGLKIHHAKTTEQFALTESDRVQRLHSRFLADLSAQQTEKGYATNGILIALAALPDESGHRPYVSDAERQLYNALIQPREHRTLLGHQQAIHQSIFSPNGQYVLTLAKDHTARLWAVETGQLMSIFTHNVGGSNQYPIQAAFSPNNQWLVTVSGDKTAQVWDVHSGDQINTLTQQRDIITAAAFSPDNQYIVTGSRAGIVRIWQFNIEQTISVLEQHPSAIQSVQFSPNGAYLLVTEKNGMVTVWDVASSQRVLAMPSSSKLSAQATFSSDSQCLILPISESDIAIWNITQRQQMRLLSNTAPLRKIQFNRDKTQFAALYTNQTIKIWHIIADQAQQTLPSNTIINTMGLSEDGTWLVSSDVDKNVTIWNTNTQQKIAVLAGHQASINHVGFSPDNAYLVTSAQDATAKLWHFNNGKQRIAFTRQPAPVEYAAFSPSLHYLATAHKKGQIHLWNDNAHLRQLKGHDATVNYISFSGDNEYILSGSDDKTMRMWHVITGKQVAIWSDYEGAVQQSIFSPLGHRILSVDNTSAYLHDVSSRELIKKISGLSNPITYAYFNQDGSYIVSLENSTASLWDGYDGELLTDLVGHENAITYTTFSPDSEYLATTSYDKTVRLWRLQRRFHNLPATVLLGHTNVVTHAAFSPDSQYLATAAYDKTARLWDVKTGEELQIFGEHTDMVVHVAFSPDGQRLLTMDYGQSAHLWDVKTGQEVVRFAGTEAIQFALFRPDGQYIFTGLKDGSLFLYPYFSSTQDLVEYARMTVSRQLNELERKQFFIE